MAGYKLLPRTVEAFNWGRTWAESKQVAKWLGESGVCFEFDMSREFADTETLGLPGLFFYDRRWNYYEVRRGDWLVKFDQGDVRVYSPAQFKSEFQER